MSDTEVLADSAICDHTLRGSLAALVDVRFLPETPHIHTHALSDESDFKEVGYYRLEMCCHGCGSSILVMYNSLGDHKLETERVRFFSTHNKCPNFGFENWCPDVRIHSEVADLRRNTKKNEDRKNNRLTPDVVTGTD